MNSQISHYIGLDVHKETIAIAQAPAIGGAPTFVGTTAFSAGQISRSLAKLGPPEHLKLCHEAGPCGYGLARELQARGYDCVIVAPSRVARQPADKIKTDRRDALLLARLHRASELTPVAIPDPHDEAIRDLVRSREDAVCARRRARQQLAAFLLRQGKRYTGGRAWTKRYQEYLSRLKFDDPVHHTLFAEARLALTAADERVSRTEQALRDHVAEWRWIDTIRALMTMRGINFLYSTATRGVGLPSKPSGPPGGEIIVTAAFTEPPSRAGHRPPAVPERAGLVHEDRRRNASSTAPLTWAQLGVQAAVGRFADDRLAGLFARHAGRERYKVTDRVEARVLARTTRHKPADGSTHWSSRKLAAELGDISHMTIARIWARHGIKPHRLEGYIASNDPDFETKAADVIGLYLNPPQHAAVFSVDEKTAVQALNRKDPVLPLSPGRAERHGFEYFRHGTLSLYAAFNTKTGEVIGKTAQRHTSAEFVAFLNDIVTNQPRGKEIHVIADNLSAHKTKQVDAFLTEHPAVHMHFTPTYSSWLNQVELWFAKIERDVIARGVFTSVPDLKRKLMRYIRQYNKHPRPVKWKYFDPSRRITPDSIVTVH